MEMVLVTEPKQCLIDLAKLGEPFPSECIPDTDVWIWDAVNRFPIQCLVEAVDESGNAQLLFHYHPIGTWKREQCFATCEEAEAAHLRAIEMEKAKAEAAEKARIETEARIVRESGWIHGRRGRYEP